MSLLANWLINTESHYRYKAPSNVTLIMRSILLKSPFQKLGICVNKLHVNILNGATGTLKLQILPS